MPSRTLTSPNRFLRTRAEVRHHLSQALRALRRENVPVLGLLSMVLALAAALGAYIFEMGPEGALPDFGDALWWMIITMSTTGYGDLIPRTLGGRVVTAMTIFSGTLLISLFTASVASALTARRIQEEKGLKKVSTRRHIVICGWNGHAQRVIEGLIGGSPGAPPEIVLVNQLPEEAIGDIVHRYLQWKIAYVRGDFCHEATLRRANLENAGAAIVLADSSAGLVSKVDDRTVLAVLAIRSLNAGIKVCAEIMEAENEAHLRRAGVDEVVVAGEHNGFLLSSAAIAPGLPQLVRELLTFDGPNGLRRWPVPPEFVGKSLGQLALHLRQTSRAIPVGIVSESGSVTLDDLLASDFSSVDGFIKQQFAQAGMEYLTLTRQRAEVVVNPPDDYVLAAGDQVVLVGGGQG